MKLCRNCAWWSLNKNTYAGPSTSGPACYGYCSRHSTATCTAYVCIAWKPEGSSLDPQTNSSEEEQSGD